MIARKGTGRMHAKWSPVSTCIMYKDPIVRLNDELVNKGTMTVEQKKEFVNLCPRKVYNYNDLKQQVEIENADKCNLCNECYKYVDEELELNKAVFIGENDVKFNFIVESTGALPPKDIVKRAFGILKTKIEGFSRDLYGNVMGGNVNNF